MQILSLHCIGKVAGTHSERIEPLEGNGLSDPVSGCSRVAGNKFTRPYRPQTNGKVERFNRTLLEEWAYVRTHLSEGGRTEALAEWLHLYNHHRNHTALGGKPPVRRVNKLAGQYS
jgi:hypothetical protein